MPMLALLLHELLQTAMALNEMSAGSRFDDYTAGVVTVVLLIGGLVVLLLGGGLLILNMGLFSKRREDRIGSRSPSDLAILQQTVWPEIDDSPHLPAAEAGDEPEDERAAWL